MATLEKLVPGQILHDYHKTRMGNTMGTREGHWTVRVIEIDLEQRRALVSWNSNPPRWVYERTIAKYRINPKKPKEIS